jgi:predicted DCC family thiol-disulfide oxidoreductase YuxK
MSLTVLLASPSRSNSFATTAAAFVNIHKAPLSTRATLLQSSSTNEGPQCDDPKIVLQRVFETDKRPIILFDGVCNLCNGAVNLALDWDPKGKLRFSALQSNVGRALLEVNGRKNDDISSIVLVTAKGAYTKSDAVLKITEELTPLGLQFLPLKPLGVLGRYAVPKFLRDIIYDGVADNRYDVLGKQDYCRFDGEGEFDDRFVDDALAVKRI